MKDNKLQLSSLLPSPDWWCIALAVCTSPATWSTLVFHSCQRKMREGQGDKLFEFGQLCCPQKLILLLLRWICMLVARCMIGISSANLVRKITKTNGCRGHHSLHQPSLTPGTVVIIPLTITNTSGTKQILHSWRHVHAREEQPDRHPFPLSGDIIIIFVLCQVT